MAGSDIYFTTNPSDFTKLEGLYVNEQTPPGFIRGVDFSTVGLAGTCVRGPEVPTIITSSGQFTSIFGGRDYGGGGSIVGNVWAALLNKPFGSLVVRRVCAAAAVAATHTFQTTGGSPTNVVVVNASSRGAWGNGVAVTISVPATDGNANHFDIAATYLGRTWTYKNCDCTTGNNNLATVLGIDPTSPITMTKAGDGVPAAVASPGTSLTTGADGTVAAADYNGGMNDLAVFPNIGVCLVPEVINTPATFYSNLVTLASEVSDRIFLTWSMSTTNAAAAEVSAQQAAITTQSDRIVWCYNAANTLDTQAGVNFAQGPHVWMACILSQVDVDVHPGSYQTQAYLAGISSLCNTSLSRGDLINLRNAGISTLEQLSTGFQFRSAVTTNLNPGLTEIVRRRECDFLQISIAQNIASYVKAKNTPEIRASMAGQITAFLQGLQDQERIVQAFSIDQVSVNNDAQRAAGEEHILIKVQLIANILYLVLDTDISTGTVIAQSS